MRLKVFKESECIIDASVKNLGVNEYKDKINIEFDSPTDEIHYDLVLKVENNYKIVIE